jgi:hypothetical protein
MTQFFVGEYQLDHYQCWHAIWKVMVKEDAARIMIGGNF